MRRNDRSVNGSESDSGDDDNEVESHVVSPSETQDMMTRGRNFVGFWSVKLLIDTFNTELPEPVHDVRPVDTKPGRQQETEHAPL
ncbi:battenin isoform X1 [Huso huso]|uniref:Battenin isoform X1 n=1 Tax=Huso huso TaxID=61971 RepID=A0ABR0Y5M5_HUSHU